MTGKRLALGVLAASAWVAAALIGFRTGQLPHRPLYDGLAPPPPYRWVRPPRDAATREAPLPGKGTVDLLPEGSRPASIGTGDGQATVVLAQGAIPLSEGETGLNVGIQPLDPARQPKPPEGLVLQGNAYEVSAKYASGARAEPAQAKVVLRYPVDATVVLAKSRSSWKRLKTVREHVALQLVADAPVPGVFVAAGPPAPSQGVPWWAWAAGGGAAAVGGIARLMQRRRHAKRSRGRASRRRKSRSRRRR